MTTGFVYEFLPNPLNNLINLLKSCTTKSANKFSAHFSIFFPFTSLKPKFSKMSLLPHGMQISTRTYSNCVRSSNGPKLVNELATRARNNGPPPERWTPHELFYSDSCHTSYKYSKKDKTHIDNLIVFKNQS